MYERVFHKSWQSVLCKGKGNTTVWERGIRGCKKSHRPFNTLNYEQTSPLDVPLYAFGLPRALHGFSLSVLHYFFTAHIFWKKLKFVKGIIILRTYLLPRAITVTAVSKKLKSKFKVSENLKISNGRYLKNPCKR